MGELEGRVIAVAGVGGGLGPVVAERLAGAGATLALADLDVDRIGAAVEGSASPRSGSTCRRSTCSTPGGGVVVLLARTGSAGSTGCCTWWRLARGDPIESPLADYEWLHDLLVRTSRTHAGLPRRSTASEHGRFADRLLAQAQAPDGTNAAYAATKAASERGPWRWPTLRRLKATANVVVVNAILTPGMRERNPGKEYPTFTPAEQIADALVYLCSERPGG